jgi:hypothetical protein
VDPLLDLIRLLRPRATLFGAGVDAFGDWWLDFRKRDDLLFCWVEQGEFQLIRPGAEPLSMQAGDFALIHTSTPFTLASDEFVEPADSETAVIATRKVRLRLGCGSERPVTLQAGKFLLEKANEALLTGRCIAKSRARGVSTYWRGIATCRDLPSPAASGRWWAWRRSTTC